MKKIILISILSTLVLNGAAWATSTDLIPSDSDNLYYEIGGGDTVPMPVFLDQETVPLDVESNVGLGYNCGVFNPELSISNSLNQIQNSFLNIKQSIMDNATSAIAEFPMYVLARANPDLYNLLNNGLLEARKDLEISTKSCQAMQNEIGAGQNPYTRWGTIAIGNDWKYHMGLAGQDNLLGDGDSSDSDINQVSKRVHQDDGKTGVPWIQGVSKNGGKYAGGEDQPKIKVIYDTSIAGYNVALQAGRDYDDTSAPSRNNKNLHLVETWSNPVLAAKWIVNVVGDETITTYSDGKKSSTPGVGLLPEVHQLSLDITKAIQKLVIGEESTNLDHLKAVSAPGVMINIAVIDAIRQKKPVTQTILTNKLGQEVATAKVIDKALLALQMLQEGSQIPAVYGNKAAQEDINKAIQRLRQDIKDFLFSVNVRKSLVSETVSQLLASNQFSQAEKLNIQASAKPNSVMQYGAIKKDQK